MSRGVASARRTRGRGLRAWPAARGVACATVGGTMASGGPPGRAPRALHSARAVDVASASSFRDFQLLHVHLDLRADFGSRTLSGSAALDLRCLAPAGAAELRLDSHPSLEVTAAALRREPSGPEEPVRFHARPFARYGSALCLSFPQPRPAGERFQVLLTYRVVGAGPGVSVQVSPRCPPRCAGASAEREEGTPTARPRRPGALRAPSSRQAARVALLRAGPHCPLQPSGLSSLRLQ